MICMKIIQGIQPYILSEERPRQKRPPAPATNQCKIRAGKTTIKLPKSAKRRGASFFSSYCPSDRSVCCPSGRYTTFLAAARSLLMSSAVSILLKIVR